jgi:hypothetical protein
MQNDVLLYSMYLTIFKYIFIMLGFKNTVLHSYYITLKKIWRKNVHLKSGAYAYNM